MLLLLLSYLALKLSLAFSLLIRVRLQEAFAFVLFTRFMAPTLQILVSEPLPLLALGQLTAIVVDVGQTETRILPV